MDTTSRNGIIAIVAILIVVGLGLFIYIQSSNPTKYDDFAKCLADKGVKFYGAFWCPHCQKEKALFGASAKYLPYVECSTPDTNSQLQVCNDEKISVYPTWKFADGTVKEGEVTLQELAEKTSCQLPQ
jgi:thiol-disulfide isomerase/thioredoxin